MELFDNYKKNESNNAPLAERIRPEKLEDFIGQEKNLLQKNEYSLPQYTRYH